MQLKIDDTGFCESIDTFTVKFGGSNSIDAETFTSIINNTVDLVKLSCKAVEPNAFLRLEIKATREGSFETIIDAVTRYATDLITKENAKLACEVIAGYLAFLKIKQHLRGKKAKEIKQKKDQAVIVNQNGETITAPLNITNYYTTNNQVDIVMSEIFTALEDSDRSEMIIEQQDSKVIFSRKDYKPMSNVIIEKSTVTSTIQSQKLQNCELIIKKPDLIGTSKWEVIFDKRIEVKIEDEEVLKQIRDGLIKISGGSKLICDLTITVELDDKLNVLNIDYIVPKIHGIKDKQEQMNFFDIQKRD